MNERVLFSAPLTIGEDSVRSAVSSSPWIVTVAVIGTSRALDPVGVEVVGEGRRAVGPARDLLPDELLGVLDQRRS